MTENARSGETQVQYHRRRAEELKRVRQPWESLWQDLADFIEPTRLELTLRDEGPVSRKKIIDSSVTLAHRTLQSGMYSGITSPSRPWFRLATREPQLREFAPVKEYLSDVERIMRDVFNRSNLYSAFRSGYGDLGQFGQFASLLVEDEQDGVRMLPLLHGHFWLARDHKGRATTLYRRFRWSVDRIVARFGYKAVSQRIKTLYDNADYDKTFDIWHAVEPRMSRDPSKIDKRNKPFLSNYWEDGSTDGQLLEESGFDENPIIAPAWEIVGENHYGISPGMVALPDSKMLMKEQSKKLAGIDKIVDPPMVAPPALRNNPKSLLPGSVTYVDDPTGKAYRPALEVNLRLSELREETRDTTDRVNRAFFADVFMMISQMEGVQPRITMEIVERREEKMVMLGPVLENVYGGQLEPTIERCFAILNRRRELPPPPEELQGQDFTIEYTSTLAQAQKAVATGAIDRWIGLIGQSAAVKPNILDKWDEDETADVYADALGVPPSIVRSDDKVGKMREARAQKQQAAENAEMAATMAPAAKAGADAAAVLAGAMENPGGAQLLNQIGVS